MIYYSQALNIKSVFMIWKSACRNEEIGHTLPEKSKCTPNLSQRGGDLRAHRQPRAAVDNLGTAGVVLIYLLIINTLSATRTAGQPVWGK